VKSLFSCAVATLVASASLLPVVTAQDSLEDRLANIKIPDGFKIEVYADNVPNARQMTLGDDGVVYVGTRDAGSVYAVVDSDGDYKVDAMHTILSRRNKLPDGSRLIMPNGVAYKDGSLYISAATHILRLDDIGANLKKPNAPVIVVDDLPMGKTHFWKVIAFGPDDKLYVPLGAPCNICENVEGQMRIIRMDANGSNREDVAYGIRHSLGFDWDPETGDFWFTDHNPEHLGPDLPPDELNRVTKAGEHFGFPYMHGTEIMDPVHGVGHTAAEFTSPAQDLNPHAGVMGFTFYTGDMFPAEYKNMIFVTEKAGYQGKAEKSQRIALVKHNGKKGTSYEPFATGWRVGDKAWGKPVDVLVMPDGSMLVSDDTAGAIYRISYSK
jgi:glucose/arabinose dehydrogenase